VNFQWTGWVLGWPRTTQEDVNNKCHRGEKTLPHVPFFQGDDSFPFWCARILSVKDDLDKRCSAERSVQRSSACFYPAESEHKNASPI